MSVKIVQKPLPAGVVPYEDVTDGIVKRKVMLLNRNIAALAEQLAVLQRAAIELQRTGGGGGGGTVDAAARARIEEVDALAKSLYEIRSYSVGSPAVGGNAGAAASPVDVSLEGYEPVAVVNADSGNSSILIARARLNAVDATVTVAVRNVSSSERAAGYVTLSFKVIYRKTLD